MIDPRFDATIRSSAALTLQYPSAEDRLNHLEPDVQVLRDALGLQRLVLLVLDTSPDGQGHVVRVRPVDGPELAAIPWSLEHKSYDEPKLRAAIQAVFGLSEYYWLPLMRRRQPVPTWAWVAGSVGAGVALVGLGFALVKHCGPDITKAGRVIDPSCWNYTSDSTLGPLLMLQALPLLSIPVVYALRRDTPLAQPRVHASVGSDRAMVFLQ